MAQRNYSVQSVRVKHVTLLLSNVIAINFVLLPSPLLSSPDPDAVTVTYMGLVFDTDIFMHQGTQGSEASVPVHHFRKSFGTSAITRIMYVSPSSRILTSFAFY